MAFQLKPALFACLCHWLLAASLQAAPTVRIAIVVDDLGSRPGQDEQVLQLPSAVAVAVLPMTRTGPELARQAAVQGREVLIHLPMESVSGKNTPPTFLNQRMNRQEVLAFLQQAHERLPQAVGLNNHQGSLATRHPVLMAWLMEALNQHRLWFLDSRTSANSLALQMAQSHHVPSTWRDVFLDHELAPQAVRQQFQRLLARARAQGTAMAIGHPHPVTIAILQQALQELPEDILLVPPSRLLNHRRPAPWQKSLSPSQKAAKNWKPSPSSTCCAVPKSR